MPISSRLLRAWPWVLLAASSVTTAQGLGMDQRLDRLEARAAKVTELTLQLDALKRENQQLRGDIELLQHELTGIKRRQRDLYLDLDQRISDLQAPQRAAPASPTMPATVPLPAPPSAAPATAPAAVAADPAQELPRYQAAYALLSADRREYAAAVEAFQQFLLDYPSGEYADNAQYWMGEASYVLQDNAAAQAAFEAVITRYPDSPKVPDALLKIGYLQHAEGQHAAARQTLQQLVERYPGTTAATLAQQRLARLARETG